MVMRSCTHRDGLRESTANLPPPREGELTRIWICRDYIQPVLYAGPTITTIHSTVNSTHWKTIYRCQNCTTWTNGDFDTDGTPVFAWVVSFTPVFDPTDVNTDFNEHDDCEFC